MQLQCPGPRANFEVAEMTFTQHGAFLSPDLPVLSLKMYVSNCCIGPNLSSQSY